MADLGWAQHTLADKVDISHRQIERLIAGTSAPTPETLNKIATVLGVAPQDIMPGGVAVSAVSAGAIPHRNPKLFGRDTLLGELRDRLQAFGQGEAEKHVLALHGMPGLGKTSLAIALVYDPEIQRAFPDGTYWETLGKKSNPLIILRKWCNDFGVPQMLDGWTPQLGKKTKHVKEAGDRFRAYLLNKGKRALFVLDDAWHMEHVSPLLVEGGGCATIITTRLLNIAEHFAPDGRNRCEPPRLGETDALALLRERAGKDRAGKYLVDQHLEACRLLRRVAAHGRSVENVIEDLKQRTEKLLHEPVPSDVQQFLEDVQNPNVVALLQKSTDELDDETREYFATLGDATLSSKSIFDLARMAGGWELSRERAQAVADTLIDNGLMEYAGELFGEPRYYITLFDDEE